VGFARFTVSAIYRQPLKYILSVDPETNGRIFSCLTWATYLKNWDGPSPGQRPTPYIVILIDETITKDWWCDDGIVAQTILLGTAEKGLGGCIIGGIAKERLRRDLAIPDHLRVRRVLALGKPAKTVVLQDLDLGGDIRFFQYGKTPN